MGSKNDHGVNTDSKEQISVLSTVNAAGEYCKPFVVLLGIRRPNYNVEYLESADDYDLAHSEKEWMTTDIFFEWLSNLFPLRSGKGGIANHSIS